MKILELLIKKNIYLKFYNFLPFLDLFRIYKKSITTILLVMMLSSCNVNNESVFTVDPSVKNKPLTPSPKILIKTPTIAKYKENLDRTNAPQTPTAPTLVLEISSPIIGIPLDELSSIISNPFHMPGKGKDDGHPGLDFSFYSYHEWKSIENLDVASVLPGYLAGVIYDRPPYGNAILIESKVQELNIELQHIIKTFYPKLPQQDHIILNCPETFNMESDFSRDNLSIYILYGHLKNFQDFEIGDYIESGTNIGKVGNTGMSGNPHLHLEIRIGPNSSVFLTMAHYDNSITVEEKENYCLWKVSGYFFPIDPNLILGFEHTKS